MGRTKAEDSRIEEDMDSIMALVQIEGTSIDKDRRGFPRQPAGSSPERGPNWRHRGDGGTRMSV